MFIFLLEKQLEYKTNLQEYANKKINIYKHILKHFIFEGNVLLLKKKD